MAGTFGAIIFLGLIIWLCCRAGKGNKSTERPPVAYTTIRCPTCGDSGRLQ